MTTRLLQILREAFAVEAVVSDDLELRAMDGWDSMQHMIFITKLESEYGIELTGDEIVEMQTVGRIREILRDNHGLDV